GVLEVYCGEYVADRDRRVDDERPGGGDAPGCCRGAGGDPFRLGRCCCGGACCGPTSRRRGTCGVARLGRQPHTSGVRRGTHGGVRRSDGGTTVFRGWHCHDRCCDT